MTEERFEEIKAEYENARGVEYVRLKFGKIGEVNTFQDAQANDDMFDLIAEVERLQKALEKATPAIYGFWEAEKQKNARLRKALERITGHRVNHFITKDAMVMSMFETAKGALQNGTD